MFFQSCTWKWRENHLFVEKDALLEARMFQLHAILQVCSSGMNVEDPSCQVAVLCMDLGAWVAPMIRRGRFGRVPTTSGLPGTLLRVHVENTCLALKKHCISDQEPGCIDVYIIHIILY